MAKHIKLILMVVCLLASMCVFSESDIFIDTVYKNDILLNEKELGELKDGIYDKHPSNYLTLASELLKRNKFDEAAFWYYVGRIRYKAYLRSQPDLIGSEESAFFAAMDMGLGYSINPYLREDKNRLVKIVSKSLKWHKKKQNGFTPKSKFSGIYKEIENDLESFLNDVKDGRYKKYRKN